MVPVVKDAVAQRKASVEIIDLRTINPLDESTIINSVKKTGKVIIVHEASLSFGPGAEIAARIAEKAIFELDAPVMRVAAPSLPYPFPGYEKYYVPNSQRVAQAIDKIMAD
jgi:pyruvate dehydrogenase E1 component beta subunit